MSAIEVTAKANFERLYLVSGPRQFMLFVTIPYAPTPPPLTLQLFLNLVIWYAGESELPKPVSRNSGQPEGKRPGRGDVI